MKDSLLGTPVDSRRHTDMLQLDDVYNMEEWSDHTQSRGYAPLVGWEEFIEHAPRDVVLVQMKYPTLSQLKATGMSFPQPVSGLVVCSCCFFVFVFLHSSTDHNIIISPYFSQTTSLTPPPPQVGPEATPSQV